MPPSTWLICTDPAVVKTDEYKSIYAPKHVTHLYKSSSCKEQMNKNRHMPPSTWLTCTNPADVKNKWIQMDICTKAHNSLVEIQQMLPRIGSRFFRHFFERVDISGAKTLHIMFMAQREMSMKWCVCQRCIMCMAWGERDRDVHACGMNWCVYQFCVCIYIHIVLCVFVLLIWDENEACLYEFVLLHIFTCT